MEKDNLAAQLDTIIGMLGGKVITVLFTTFNFVFCLFLAHKSSAQAAAEFQNIKRDSDAEGFIFSDLMPVML